MNHMLHRLEHAINHMNAFGMPREYRVIEMSDDVATGITEEMKMYRDESGSRDKFMGIPVVRVGGRQVCQLYYRNVDRAYFNIDLTGRAFAGAPAAEWKQLDKELIH